MAVTRTTKSRKSSAGKTKKRLAAKGGLAGGKRRPPRSPATAPTLKRLQSCLDRSWSRPPADVRKLRRHRLPPMGRMPCMLYANFNTFWAGENIQVMRQLALDGEIDLKELNRVMGAVLRRHAARLAKWKLDDTVGLFKYLALYFERRGPRSGPEFAEVAEAMMVTIDRINAWIDAMIPWSQLDRKVTPNRLPA